MKIERLSSCQWSEEHLVSSAHELNYFTVYRVLFPTSATDLKNSGHLPGNVNATQQTSRPTEHILY